jgi:hypothetical protein
MQLARWGVSVQMQVSSSFLHLIGHHEDSSSIQARFVSVYMYIKSGVQTFLFQKSGICRTCDMKRGPYQHLQTLYSQASTHRAVTAEAFVRSRAREGGICGGLCRYATGLSTSATVPSLSFRHYFILIFILILFIIIRTSGRRVGTFKQRISVADVEAY